MFSALDPCGVGDKPADGGRRYPCASLRSVGGRAARADDRIVYDRGVSLRISNRSWPRRNRCERPQGGVE